MKPIGGFFDLELPSSGVGPHPGAIALATGRACMALWLREVRPAFCYVPFYSCDALFDPLIHEGIPFRFYAIDEQLHPIGLPEHPESDEWLVWTNFFGVLRNQLKHTAEEWGGRVLIDNTHAFFDAQESGLWSFTSARKYFGVPDGAYCYRPNGDVTPPHVERFVPASAHHLVARYTKSEEAAFGLYQAAEAALDCSLLRISTFAERVMACIDTDLVKALRRRNLTILMDRLAEYNTFRPASFVRSKSAFCYPFLPQKGIPRSELYAKNIFIATLWPDVIQREGDGFDYERRLSKTLLPLPIDHRYQPQDMVRLATTLIDYLK